MNEQKKIAKEDEEEHRKRMPQAKKFCDNHVPDYRPQHIFSSHIINRQWIARIF